MRSIGNILGNHRTDTPMLRRATAALIVDTANDALAEIFGKEITSFAAASFVKNRVLSVKCMSAAAAQEIRLNQNKILAKINEKIGFNAIDKIQYIV